MVGTRTKPKTSVSEEEENTGNAAILKKLETLDILQKDLTEIKSNTREISAKIASFECKFDEVDDRVAALQTEVNQLKRTLEKVEKDSKRKNIIVSGIPETDDEKINQVVDTFLKDQLKVNVSYESTMRIGRQKEDYARPIKICFLRQEDKWAAIKQRRLLKESNIYINDDLTKSELSNSDLLRKYRNEAQKEGKKTFYKKGRLHIDGIPFMVRNQKVIPAPKE